MMDTDFLNTILTKKGDGGEIYVVMEAVEKQVVLYNMEDNSVVWINQGLRLSRLKSTIIEKGSNGENDESISVLSGMLVLGLRSLGGSNMMVELCINHMGRTTSKEIGNGDITSLLQNISSHRFQVCTRYQWMNLFHPHRC
jgi:hypothetical protein